MSFPARSHAGQMAGAGKEMAIEPALATSWEPIGDGEGWRFTLREGVTFHDGTPLTAEDVKYSWDRVMTMSLPESAADVLNDIVAETRVVDDFTFEVDLQVASAAFLNTAVVAMVFLVRIDPVVGHRGFGFG